MNDKKHHDTKLNVEMWQIGMIFDSLSDEKKKSVVDAIMNCERDDEEKVPIIVGDVSYLFTELNDVVRMELIKSLIWTANDMHLFYEKVKKLIASRFEETLD